MINLARVLVSNIVLGGVTMIDDEVDPRNFILQCSYASVPDFKFVWDDEGKGKYKVKISYTQFDNDSREYVKVCSELYTLHIFNTMQFAEFVSMYGFMYTARASSLFVEN